MERKNKVLLTLAIGAIVILIGSTVVRCALTSDSSRNEATAGEASVAEKPVSTGTTSSAGQQAGADESGQTRETGTQVEEEALGLLYGSIWKSADGVCSAVFKEGRFSETDGTQGTITTYDVASVSVDDGQMTLMLRLDATSSSEEKDCVLLLRQGEDDRWSASCDDFRLSKTYVQQIGERGSFSVVGVGVELAELLGGETDKLEDALASYTANNIPSATTATWTSEVVLDYKEQTLSTSFNCNDAGSTVLVVSRMLSGGEFTVTGG